MSNDRLPAIEPWPITATVRRFKELSGLGSTSVYEMIKSGDIQSVTIGRRRLIVMNSYREFLNSRLSASDRHAPWRRDGPKYGPLPDPDG